MHLRQAWPIGWPGQYLIAVLGRGTVPIRLAEARHWGVLVAVRLLPDDQFAHGGQFIAQCIAFVNRDYLRIIERCAQPIHQCGCPRPILCRYYY